MMNDLTIYGTLMDPSSGLYATRIPNKNGFIRDTVLSPEAATSHLEKQVEEYEKLRQCKICWNLFSIKDNSKGRCGHGGDWHSAFSDCGPKCAVFLGVSLNIGKQHWSCCFSTSRDSRCPKSGQHEVESK